MVTNIKKYSVGSPIQAPVEALSILISRSGIKAADVESIEVRVPGFGVVNNRMMPDINLQYCIAATMLDGGLSFQAAHDYARMQDADIVRMMKRLSVVEDVSLRREETSRTARVTVKLRDGRSLSELVTAVPGTAQNPMTTEQVTAKCRDIVLDPLQGQQLVAQSIVGAVRIFRSANDRKIQISQQANAIVHADK